MVTEIPLVPKNGPQPHPLFNRPEEHQAFQAWFTQRMTQASQEEKQRHIAARNKARQDPNDRTHHKSTRRKAQRAKVD